MTTKPTRLDQVIMVCGFAVGIAASVYFGVRMGIAGYITGALVGFFGVYALCVIGYKVLLLLRKLQFRRKS